MKNVMKHLNSMKAPDDDLTNQILQKLPEMEIKYITQLCNALFRQGFFPPQWKVAQIIMIQKQVCKTCRIISISLLPVRSKLFEKLLLSRISIIIESHGLIHWLSIHWFYFQSEHATIQQIHKIVKRLNKNMDAGLHRSLLQ